MHKLGKREEMAIVYILIGLPGAGKTTYAETKLGDALSIGTDMIRKEYFGKEMTPRGYVRVRRELVRRVAKTAASGIDVAVDCTNLTKKRRKRLLAALPDDCTAIAVWINTPLKMALTNNASRTRHVPVLGIISLSLFLQRPEMTEGFSEIRII